LQFFSKYSVAERMYTDLRNCWRY